MFPNPFNIIMCIVGQRGQVYNFWLKSTFVTLLPIICLPVARCCAQAERDILQTYVATLKGKAAAQQAPQQSSARQPQRGHMLAMLCIEPGSGGNLCRPMESAPSAAMPAAAAAVSATAAPAAAALPSPGAATMQASSSLPPSPPLPAAAAAMASAAREETAHHSAESPPAGACSPAAQAAGSRSGRSPARQPAAEAPRGKLVLGSGVGQRVAALLQQQHCDDGDNVWTSPTAGATAAPGLEPMQPAAEMPWNASSHAVAAVAAAAAQNAEATGQHGQQGQPDSSTAAAAVPAEAAAATAGAEAGAHAAEQVAVDPAQPPPPSLATQWAVEVHRQAVDYYNWAALYSAYSQQYAAAAWQTAYQVESPHKAQTCFSST